VRFRLKFQILRQSRIGLVTVVAALTSMVLFAAGPFDRLPLSKEMVKLIHEAPLVPNIFPASEELLNLLIFILIKFALTIFNIILPIPGGAITPFLVLGAALGRLFGELLNLRFVTGIIPAGYAVIGSAGLVSGTIRALSPAVFVLELTGQLSLLIPVLMCSITAMAVGNFFNRPLFDTALKIQNLPFLSNFRSEKVYQMAAKDVMQVDLHFISVSSTLAEIKAYLDKYDDRFIPLVQSQATMVLEGIAERKSLAYVVDEYIEQWKARHRPPENSAVVVTAQEDAHHDLVELEEIRHEPKEEEEEREEGEEKTEKEEDRGWEKEILADVMSDAETAILMDFAPSQTPEATPLNKVFHLFIMLGLSFTFVTRYGSLVGVITKKDLIKKEL